MTSLNMHEPRFVRLEGLLTIGTIIAEVEMV